jgi:hypothetical protein
LLTAVESVLNEEREIDAIRQQVQSLRSDVLAADRRAGLVVAGTAPALESDVATVAQSAFSLKTALPTGHVDLGGLGSTESLLTLRRLTAALDAKQNAATAAPANPAGSATSNVAPHSARADAHALAQGLLQAHHAAAMTVEALKTQLNTVMEQSKIQVAQTLQSIQEQYASVRAKQQQLALSAPGDMLQTSQLTAEAQVLTHRVQATAMGFHTMFSDLSRFVVISFSFYYGPVVT